MNILKNQCIKTFVVILFAIAIISVFTSTGWTQVDAEVTDIFTPSSLVALQTFVVTVEMFNYGTAGTVPLSMYIDGSYQTTFYIPMNEWSYSYVDITVGGFTAGYHTLKFCSTNCRTEGWTWSGTPDLQLFDIYEPTSLTALQDTNLTARIDNTGNADAGIYYVALYIDGSLVNAWSVNGLCALCWTEFSVTITGFTAGQHSIKFVADYFDDVWEQSELNNERTEYFTWTGTPDLQLTDIYQPSSLASGNDTTITARIDNVGNANAGPFELDLYIDGNWVETWTYSSGLQTQYYSEPSVIITGGLVDGLHNIEFVADVLGQVAESNESNNNRTESFTWTGGVPDLELTDIYQPSSLTSGTDATITAKLTNIGYADAGPFELELYIDGNWVSTWTYSSGLQAQYYSDPSVTLTGGLVDGSHDLEFYSDVLYQVSESDEINNNRIESFTWTGGVPDLELTDIYQPSSLTSGTDTTITAKLTNVGYADAGPFELDLFIDANWVATWTYSSGLPALYYSEPSIDLTGFIDGTHDLEFDSDVLYQVSESDETNNNRIESFMWSDGIPDLELTDIYTPSSLTAFEDTTITGKITNIGYADTIPFYVDMYIDDLHVARWDYYAGLPAWTYSEAAVDVIGLEAGPHEIEYFADAFDEVVESDETNNSNFEMFTWEDPSSSCTSTYGEGNGVLGDRKDHIDTCYDSSDPTYKLQDMSRQAGQTAHIHAGQMGANSSIVTYHYDEGLMKDTDNDWNATNQRAGVDAHVYAAWVYDYLYSTFGLNSYDDNGSSMMSQVENTATSDNAGWNGQRVTYYIGSLKPSYAGALDVVAHEWGHALTGEASQRFPMPCLGELSKDLCYENESGALNEAFSDWLGVAVDHYYGRYNWTHGEAVGTDRDLSNPPSKTSWCDQAYRPQPDHMNNYRVCSNDNGGVHLNSGIPNKMFYLLAETGAHIHSNISVQGIGIIKAMKIAWRANDRYWLNYATFQDALDGMVTAAIDL